MRKSTSFQNNYYEAQQALAQILMRQLPHSLSQILFIRCHWHLKKQEKLARKALQKAKKAEEEALFGEALMAVSKKGGSKFDGKEGKVEALVVV